jgi:hypothetical protein
MLRISAQREIGVLRSLRKNPVRPQVDIVVPIFVMQDPAISRHEHRDRIRQQKHSGGDRPSRAIDPRMPNSRIFQVDSIHQVVEGHVGIATANARQQRGDQPHKSIDGISAECAEKKIEPHNVWFQLPDGIEKPNRARGVVHRPAALQ